MRDFREAAADSSQSASLVEADGAAITNNREKGRDAVENLNNLDSLLRRLLLGDGRCSSLQRGSDKLGDRSGDRVHGFVGWTCFGSSCWFAGRWLGCVRLAIYEN